MTPQKSWVKWILNEQFIHYIEVEPLTLPMGYSMGYNMGQGIGYGIY